MQEEAQGLHINNPKIKHREAKYGTVSKSSQQRHTPVPRRSVIFRLEDRISNSFFRTGLLIFISKLDTGQSFSKVLHFMISLFHKLPGSLTNHTNIFYCDNYVDLGSENVFITVK